MYILYIYKYTNDIQAIYEQYINLIKTNRRWAIKYQHCRNLGKI